MKKRYKTTIATIIATATLTGFAASSGNNPSPIGFALLGNQIKALVTASVREFNDFMFQADKYFPSSVNNASAQASENANAISGQLTQDQIDNQLSSIPEQAIPASPLGDSDLIKKLKARKDLLKNLTLGTPASDTLYNNGMTGLLSGVFGAPKPATTYNNYFNFDSLIEPSAYTSKQQKAAGMYLQYLTRNYKSITPGIDYQGLKNKLLSISNPIKRAKWLKTNILDNPKYQKYELSVRSNVAARSLALSNFNQLLAQRIPVKNLGSNAGLPQDPNLPNGYASPMQAQDYAALKLVNNPDWYKSMKTASPATVDREQLLLLATIVKQNQQAEQTRERELATLSLMTLEVNSTQSLLMQTQAQQINSIWSSKQDDDDNNQSSDNSDAGNFQAQAQAQAKKHKAAAKKKAKQGDSN